MIEKKRRRGGGEEKRSRDKNKINHLVVVRGKAVGVGYEFLNC